MKNNQSTEKITLGSKVAQAVHCAQCKKSGTTDLFHTYQTKDKKEMHLCPECRTAINSVFEKETQNIHYVRAVISGVIASVIGGVIWYWIVIVTGYEVGYVAIGLGALIGTALVFGAGNKRSMYLQILAVVLTFITIFVAKHSIFDHVLNEYIQSNLAEFPDFTDETVVSMGWFSEPFLTSLISPIGLVIYAIGAFAAFRIPQPRKI